MSMIDKYHQAAAVTQSPLQNKLWRLTFFWSLHQLCRGAGSLILVPLLISGGINFTMHCFDRFYKEFCTIGVCLRNSKSRLQSPHGFKIALFIPNSTGSRRVPWSLGSNPCWQQHLQVWVPDRDTCQLPAEALPKHCCHFTCCIPKPAHLLSTPFPQWSWTESLSLSYLAGVLKT